MKKYFFTGIILLICNLYSYSQIKEISIPFIDNLPIIDGLPDNNLNTFQWQNFLYTEKTNSNNKEYSVHYKMLYGYTFLYLIIECNSDSIICRDRAYQNGDGFHLVISKSHSDDELADEFYVLRFSPENTAKQTPAKKGVWYYNIDLSGKSLSGETQFACKSDGGMSYFELLLSWDDVYPYNPFFVDDIGINFCFVKAIGESEKNYYYLRFDERMQSELSKREYLKTGFLKPGKTSPSCSIAKLFKRNIQTGENNGISFFTFAKNKYLSNFFIRLYSSDSVLLKEINLNVLQNEGINYNDFDLPVADFPPGEYFINWKTNDNSKGQIPFSILPVINYENEKSILDDSKNIISDGNYNTLLFMLQNIVRYYNKVKPYETAGKISESYYKYKNYINEIKNNVDPIANKRGVFRRAFFSGIDNTLQPYTVKVPEGYDKNTKYPLLIMLHGSGSDDRDMLSGTPLSENNFIEIAPFGRGTSNCFTTDSAQIDIKEAIDDVIKNYSIDTNKIIIAGFSMGGYGAYRTFYEYPDLFKAIAVFSGHPSLATKWIGEGYPDFLDDKYLKRFKNIPVFIYHSKNDLNCPFNLTEDLVKKLITVGAKVEFVITQESGHGIIDKENIGKYYEWLKKIF